MSSKPPHNHFKYRRVYEYLQRMVQEGHFTHGQRLPTEAELTEQFGVSRPTVTRALNALQAEGIISRRAGSGSYVQPVNPADNANRLFGLLIPGLGKGEIFEPICAQIAARAEANDFSLLWSGSHLRTEEAAEILVDVTRRYIDNQVAGVFFEPLELSPSFDMINRRLVSMLEEANIPIVLIDSDYLPFPQRSSYDLVGIDNFRSGYLVAEHYLQRGVTRVDFVARPYSAYTISIRLRGYRAALLDYGIVPQPEWVHLGEPEDEQFIQDGLIGSEARHIICGNDETAAALMPQLEKCGIGIPQDMAVVAFDDIRYASMLKVPLTTFHQPVQQIGDLALEAMLSRLAHPTEPPRTITVAGTMITRQSCGGEYGEWV